MNRKAKAPDERDLWKPRNAEDAKWLKLSSRGDFVGLRCLRAAQLRRKRRLAKSERHFLKEFESDERRILRDPQALMVKGFETVNRGLVILETIIHEKRLQNLSEREDATLYETVSLLSAVASRLRDDIIRHAEDGMPWACQAVFRDGKALASAFSRLAIAYPQHFQDYAEQSLTMPSLRARNPAFTCDAEAIIRAIHLAEKHHASNLHDNRTRIGALCHQLVAEIVDLLVACRVEARESGRTDSKWFNLPDLKGNAKAWWKAELKKRIDREFDKMKTNPCRNPALWEELEKASDYGTDSAKRAALEKYCFNKLEQIAGKPPPAISVR
ncbi:hypothetical protein SBV1_1220005 [Verrucomicrobia bacterium]|nr:hypothetical protein SBV1_1220005 [Verrucomicrobiota bacterium]